MNAMTAPKSFSQTSVENSKVCFNGHVAVLVSRGFGAGWSTWNTDVKCLFTPEVVKQVMEGTVTEFSLKQVYEPERVCVGGLDGLCVVWLKVGTKFRVTEYDGAEGLETLDGTKWETA